MKRIISVLVAGVLCASLVACSANKDAGDDTTSNGNISVSGSDNKDNLVEAEREYQVELVMVTGDDVNIRAGAGTSYNIYGQGSTGEYFKLIESGDSWHQIEYSGQTAYISANYSTVKTFSSSEADQYLNGGSAEDTNADGASTNE